MKYIVLLLFGGMTAMLLVLSAASTVYIDQGGNLSFFNDSVLKHVLVILAVIAAGVFVRYAFARRSGFHGFRKVMIILTIINMIALSIWVLVTQFIPGSDQQYIIESVTALLAGDVTPWKAEGSGGFGGYMFLYPFQNALALLEYLLAKVVGNVPFIGMQIANIIFLILGLWAIYRTFRLMKVSEKVSACIYLLMPVWFPIASYVTFVYGNLMGFGLAMLAVMCMYLYFDCCKCRYMICSALLIGLAIALKSNYLIIMIAMMILIVYDSIHRKNIKTAAWILALLVSYLGIYHGTDLIMEQLTDTPTPAGIPKSAWVYMGITGDADSRYGWFDGYNVYIYRKTGFDYDASKAKIADGIQQRITEFVKKPVYTAQFFKKKIQSIWSEPTFQCFNLITMRESRITIPEAVNEVIRDGRTTNEILRELLNMMQTLVYFGAFAYVLLNWRNLDLYQLIFAIIFIGGFLFHLAWESKGQYTIIYFYMIIPYAICGWNDIFVKAANKLGDRHGKVKV